MTLPEGTVALLCMVTVPTVSVAPVSAAVAAACVRPTTFGTAAEGRAFVAVVSVLLQPKSRQTQITPSAPRCQCDCLMNLNLAPLGCRAGSNCRRERTIANSTVYYSPRCDHCRPADPYLGSSATPLTQRH